MTEVQARLIALRTMSRRKRWERIGKSALLVAVIMSAFTFGEIEGRMETENKYAPVIAGVISDLDATKKEIDEAIKKANNCKPTWRNNT